MDELEYRNNLENIRFELKTSSRVLISHFMRLSQTKDSKEKIQIYDFISAITFRIEMLKWVLDSQN